VNRVHNWYCSSDRWARGVEDKLLPWGLNGVELGDDVLEIGPGFGATSKVLAKNPGKLSILELEPDYCDHLRATLGDSVEVVQGDATRMPFDDGSFSGVVCFTMLHHIPSHELQDQLFREAFRVLRPGGTFAGTDSIGRGVLFKLFHIGDTLVLVDPEGLPGRLAAAGFDEVRVSASKQSLRFSARKPLDTLGE
jgi:SAM-dependent methyltransferase